LSFSGIRNWCETQWGSGLSIRSLEKGFFLVLFRSAAQKNDTMERKNFLLSDSGLVIRDWEPLFDCNRADADGHQVWIRLYSLPSEFWSAPILTKICSSLGRVIRIDPVTLNGTLSSFARICISVNPALKLKEVIHINSPSGLWKQRVAYEGLSNLCF
ncbi:hypothetical protein KI387_044440, partial [Taxus chinensis]